MAASEAEALTIEVFEVKRFPKQFRLLGLILTVAFAGTCLACAPRAADGSSPITVVPAEGAVSPSGSENPESSLVSRTETFDVSLSQTLPDDVRESAQNGTKDTSEQAIKETSQETTMQTEQTTFITTAQPEEETNAPTEETAYPAKTAALTAFSSVDVSGWSEEEIRDCFYGEEISDEVFARMDGKSYKADCTTKRSDLRYIRVLHMGFDGQTRVGELVANKKITQDFIDIFYELYINDYPIEKMVLVDEYGADDNLSMADNNTSCFNFRRVVGTSTLSRHALGMAIDVNPLYNPWVYELDGEPIVDPPGGAPYVDRTVDCPYIIDHDDLCYQLLIQHGFTWGGDWATEMDYQHFSKTP